MRQTDRHGGSTCVAGIRAAALVAIALFGVLLLGPSLAEGIVSTPSAPAPVNTVAPALSGTPAVGQTLTCSPGSWVNNPTGYSYTWLRSGSAIAGQTGNTYLVQAADQGHSISCQVTAGNGGGNYTISGLPSGSYKVEFFSESQGSNYVSQYFNGKSVYTEATPVSVAAPGGTGGINAELHAGGQISGRVTVAPSHSALANVEVCAEEAAAGGLFGGCADTNGNGEYTITGLASASYKVEFYPGYRTPYLDQYYNGESSSSAANLVSVTAPGATAGINAELQPGAQISGKVTDASSHVGLAKIEVCAEGSSGEYFGGCATTNSGGEYTIVGLPEGSYTVNFFTGYEDQSANYVTQYWENKETYLTATPVSVTLSHPTENINAEMHAGAQISGKITDASTHAGLAKTEACALEAATGYYVRCAAANDNGEYTIVGLASGSYKVAFYVDYSGGNYLPQYWENKESLTEATAVTVSAPGSVSNINAEMHPGGQIAGRVTGAATHAPVEKVDVCADGVDGDYGGCAETNTNGEYTLSSLPSGSYSVVFYPSSNENVNFLSQTVAGVTVNAPSLTSGVNAELQAGGQISGRVTDASTHVGLADVEVCADETGSGEFGKCANTSASGSSASAASSALTVPGSNFTQAKAPVFEAKKGDLDFFFVVSTAGTFHWSLFFRNADVGFADSLGISLGDTLTVAEAAKRKGKAKAKKCKKGTIKHKGKCVSVLVPFSSGSQSVPAGTVEVKVHADSKALKALQAGRTLHVSGTVTFQSALGGPPVTHSVSATVHVSKKAAKKHSRHKKH